MPRDLLTNPPWQADDIGRPIPDSVHAVSMALPRWQDVVGYEEKNPAVLSRLTSGYPRFVIHPLVQQMARQLGGWPFPSARVAQLAAAFVQRSGAPATVTAVIGQVVPTGAVIQGLPEL